MPNGGIENCGTCGFNQVNKGVWGAIDYKDDEQFDNAYCTIRNVRIENPLWTYCVNCHSMDSEPEGPICMVGLAEKVAGYLYARIPWHGNEKPQLCVPGPCECGRFAQEGIAIETANGTKHFCCNGHYVKWWRSEHPGETYKWSLETWPEPDDHTAEG